MFDSPKLGQVEGTSGSIGIQDCERGADRRAGEGVPAFAVAGIGRKTESGLKRSLKKRSDFFDLVSPNIAIELFRNAVEQLAIVESGLSSVLIGT